MLLAIQGGKTLSGNRQTFGGGATAAQIQVADLSPIRRCAWWIGGRASAGPKTACAESRRGVCQVENVRGMSVRSSSGHYAIAVVGISAADVEIGDVQPRDGYGDGG
jgi:hypothetical protein